MNGLEITPAALIAKADEMEMQREHQADIMRQLRTIVYGLDQVWQGDAQTAFIEKFTNQQQKINAFLQALSEFISFTKQVAQEAVNGDNELLSYVNRI